MEKLKNILICLVHLLEVNLILLLWKLIVLFYVTYSHDAKRVSKTVLKGAVLDKSLTNCLLTTHSFQSRAFLNVTRVDL